jgi:hypothetical protein
MDLYSPLTVQNAPFMIKQKVVFFKLRALTWLGFFADNGVFLSPLPRRGKGWVPTIKNNAPGPSHGGEVIV